MSEPMKAIVVRQPWATLIALGFKTIETRPAPPNGPMRPAGVRGLPGCSVERGERIAIVAGAQKPKRRHETHWGSRDDDTDPLIEAYEAPWLWTEYDDGTGGYWEWWGGPGLGGVFALGAVVCSVVVADALPIIDASGMSAGDGTVSVPDGLYRTGPAGSDLDGRRGHHLWQLHDDWPHQVSDHLPLGDFTPGRWGWMLTDPQPCEPIPCKGRQGVFVLPGDVSGQIA